MRAKKTRKTARSIRYLLSADWGQHRISLKKISERIKKAGKPARSKPARRSASRRGSRETMTIGSRTMLLAIIVAVIGTAALIAARQPSTSADMTTVAESIDTASTTETARMHLMDRALPIEAAKKPAATTPAAKPAPALPVDPIRKYETPPAAVIPASPSPMREPAEPMTKPEVSPAAITIEGCVRRENDGFWLKDTSGEDAPKSRNWKFGFLKKRSTSIYLVDSRDGVRLDDYVGRRVAATGTLVDREMRPRSVRQIAAVCN